ncbi:MAG: ABC transporter ATP-binding protein [Blautia sp.]|nr:ABC transporter ATP-binding protein [Blautia sp.]MDD7728987.1 ABC transporter ATP-binding protein [Clostridia bacterium]MDY5663578.1 ABC transporter ATP-binding protein [Blautia sp.]
MIEIKGCSKTFDDIKAVSQVSLDIGDREVFGLVGSNGAGKSTLLRMMAGIIKPDTGEILIDGKPVYENEEAKSQFFYISDDSYFPVVYTPNDMVRFYRNFYPGFQMQRYTRLMKQFHLDEKRKIGTFSKGMKKQLLVIFGVSAGTKYLFCDETFDGLDPVMRQAVKSLFAAEIMNREFTPVIASHNLRELEDVCDHVGLLHEGGILLSKDLEEMKLHIHKIQCVLTDREREKELEKELDILKIQHQGSLLLITARGTRSEIMAKIQSKKPLFCEVIPLTLEEIFISETEVAGYEIKNLF